MVDETGPIGPRAPRCFGAAVTLRTRPMITRDDLYIDGGYVRARGDGTLEVDAAGTGEIIGRIPRASREDVDAAVAAARRAFDEGPFPKWSPADRAAAITRLSAAILGRADELARTIAEENGAPILTATGMQVLSATMALDSYVGLAETYPFETERVGALGQKVRVRSVPVGVCACIVPWNVPVGLAAIKLGAALLAGCTVVLKPSPETGLDPYLLADAIAEAEIPPGVVNVVTADAAVSEYLVTHPGVDKVSFTGSTRAGKRIGEICGGQLKPCTLELGGKSAAILLDDFDLEAQGRELLGGAMLNNGQGCADQTRLLFPRARFDELADGLAAMMQSMKVGDPLDAETEIGPVVSRRQRDRIEGLLEGAKRDGAVARCGGGRPAGLDRGWFIEPTLFTGVHNDMEIARQEVFGPVLVAMPYDDVDEAVAIANDSEYGLGGGVWGADAEQAASVGARLRTGCVTVNHGMLLDFNSPFGGFKNSGLGRELGPEGVAPYVELQSILFAPGG